MSQGVPRLEILGISKHFGRTPVLHEVTLSLAPGELCSLLGPSGCGKTSLLRIIAGLTQPDEGRILLDGEDITHLPAHRRPFNLVFQSYALFPHMTVAQNIAFGLRQARLPRQQIQTRVAAMLELVRLPDYGQRRPDQLSGGQRQRVALARALALQPQLLLLDEPLAALDKRLREQTRLELLKLQQELGLTMLLVTHDQDEAMSLSHRVAMMSAGRIVQQGSPRTLYEQPASREVAEFMGASNLLTGVVIAGAPGRLRIRLDTGDEVRAPSALALAAGTSVNLVLRPEQLRLALARDDDNQLHGEIVHIADLGRLQLAHVRLSDQSLIKVQLTHLADTAPTAPGAQVALSWPSTVGVVLTA